MKISTEDIKKGLPLTLSGEVTSIIPMGSYAICVFECSSTGQEYTVPITRDHISSMFSAKGVFPLEPGEPEPVHTKPSSREASVKLGPAIGDRRKLKGILKECIRYDFESDKPGKRRQRDPGSGRLGYPVWVPV